MQPCGRGPRVHWWSGAFVVEVGIGDRLADSSPARWSDAGLRRPPNGCSRPARSRSGNTIERAMGELSR